jgi:hypothetical protein
MGYSPLVARARRGLGAIDAMVGASAPWGCSMTDPRIAYVQRRRTQMAAQIIHTFERHCPSDSGADL